ncbi:MAG TPA: c-type cytochrome, partial [Gemmata sp.]|nr:c-type cytochrome [Gemmata sp.]
NWFGCDNSNLVRHYVLEDHYLRRNPHVAYPNTSVNVAHGNRVFPIKADAQRFALSGPLGGVTAACGLGIYRDDLLGPDFTGNAFTCETVNLLVTRTVLKPSGSTFRGERAPDEADREFLASADGWFRPVHAVTGPDGGLWVADMYRYLIEHPRWIPPADLANIDTRAGAGLGRIYRVRPADKPLRKWERLDKLDTAGLVAALDSPNGWQRDMAMMMLIWKNDEKAKEPLERLVRGAKSGLTRMQALCTLGAMGQSTGELVEPSTRDKDMGVRRHALRLFEPHLQNGAHIIIALLQLAEEKADVQVRLQLACALGQWPQDDSAILLRQLVLNHIDDPYLTAAVTSSLNKDNVALVSTLLGARAENEPPHELIRNVFATAAGMDGGSALPQLLATVRVGENGAFRPWQLAAVAGALDSLERQGKPWGKLAPEVRKPVEPVVAFARAVVQKDIATEEYTLAAIPLLARDPVTRAEDLKHLAALLAATRPAAVQSAAVAALSRTSDPAAAAAIIGAWGRATPALRTRILDSLLARAAWHAELLTAIERGTIPPGQIDAARRQRFAGAADAATRERAAKLFAGGTSADRQKVIDDYKAALGLKADTTRGKAVFVKACSACHQLEGVGHAVGPDLAALANKSPLYLLSEVFDPSRNLDSRYSEYQAITKDERTISGILAAETATAITLRGQQGKDETILRSDVQTLRGGGKSLMPEGLEKEVSKQDAADLLAYLTASEPKPKQLSGNHPTEIAASDNTLTLPATKAFVYGNDLTLEHQFQNIGYWHHEYD